MANADRRRETIAAVRPPPARCRAGRGRPPTGHDPVISLRLSRELIAAIEAARAEDESRSDFIAGAIGREITRRQHGGR
jgi:hypothetical protein